jgi:hypothetical protein
MIRRKNDNTESGGFFFKPKITRQLMKDVIDGIGKNDIHAQQMKVDTNICDEHFLFNFQGKTIRTIESTDEYQRFLAFMEENNKVEITSIRILCRINNNHNGFPQFEIIYLINGIFGQIYSRSINNEAIHPDNVKLSATMISAAIKDLEYVTRNQVQAEQDERGLADRLTAFEGLTNTITASSTRLDELVTASVSKVMAGSLEVNQKAQEFINTERSRLLKEFSDKEDALARKVAEHEVVRKSFNDQNNTLVRRKLLEEIKGELEKYRKIELSIETNRKHEKIGRACIYMMIGAAIGIATSTSFLIYEKDFYLIFPLATSTGFLGSTFVYYLRITSAWARQHAELEMENLRYTYDMLRAGWFAELLFEYKILAKDKELPDSIATVMTKGLFESRIGTNPGAKHPIDDIFDLIKKYKSVEIGKDGVKVGK